MKLVIDIPEGIYTWIQREWVECDFDSVINHALNGIKNGTPLEQHRNITNEEMYQQLTHLEAENERLHDALETQPTEECEDNGSPWCLGHCPYRNTSQCPYEDTIHREEVLKIIDNLSDLSYRWNVARYIINNLPSATPKRTFMGDKE